MTKSALLVATRKGLIHVHNDQIVAHHFPGDAISQVLVDSRDGRWYAAQNLGHFGVKLKSSIDRGTTWIELNAPALPLKPTEGEWANDPTPWNVELIWELAQGGNDVPGELWAGTIPGALFRSTDYGMTWKLNEALWHEPLRLEWFGGGYDHPGIHSILIDPHNPLHITLGISSGGIWESYDRGDSWAIIGNGQYADFLPPEQAGVLHQQDPHRLASCAAHPDRLWVQHHGGQYISHDRAKNVQPINKNSGVDFGFAVAADPVDPSRAWFVPGIADAQRYPAKGALCVLRTSDGGKSFEQLRSGLPQHACFDLVYRHGLIVDNIGQDLAMGSTTGHLWTTQNAGDHWHQSPMMLPPIYSICWA